MTPAAAPRTATAAPVLLLVAHGSRDPRHAATVRTLAARVAALRPRTRVETAFLDHCDPAAGAVLDRLAAGAVRDVVAVPLLLTAAYHARCDVPSVLAAARERHPGLTLRQAPVLGPSPLLVEALERRLSEAGAAWDRASTAVVLAAAGTSDAGALAVIEDVARQWRERGGWRAVRPAYASTASPRTGDAVRALRGEGARHIVVAPYVLAPGRLPDRVAADAADSGADLLSGVLGPAPEVARLVLRRFDAAL
ncbi:sirohydrochlorin chelatase [Streptomyces sp. SL13]|uniref:Sirohydrochlorin chelatase n=1 Tax=Streptantibioticus silvisoli TaxID=2705255 RepID=A0AA90HA22_9ACTN|nr:sirohydrochlorin chelatase [Streptantibioticus silvisoli]MDI5971735.1 sirohydrochlorin chelatase [Streptantibioticus silvisoli]